MKEIIAPIRIEKIIENPRDTPSIFTKNKSNVIIFGLRFVNIKKINPIARAFAYLRKRTQVVPPKKGKGSYNRKREKKDER